MGIKHSGGTGLVFCDVQWLSLELYDQDAIMDCSNFYFILTIMRVARVSRPLTSNSAFGLSGRDVSRFTGLPISFAELHPILRAAGNHVQNAK